MEHIINDSRLEIVLAEGGGYLKRIGSNRSDHWEIIK